MKQTDITIGRLSARTGVKIETIRYYEKIALMPEPPRSQGGHRLYDPAHADRLAFIRRSRELGFSLADIRTLLGLEDQPPSCAQVHAITVHHRGEIRKKIADLTRLEQTLTEIAETCDQSNIQGCPIIKALSAN